MHRAKLAVALLQFLAAFVLAPLPAAARQPAVSIGGARPSTVRFIKNAAAAGGALKYVATDEPLVSGTGACHLSMEEHGHPRRRLRQGAPRRQGRACSATPS